MAQAVGPDSYAIRRMVRELGEETAAAWMGIVIAEADTLCGGKNDPGTLAMFARMVLQQFGHRSVESLCMAIRDGLQGKVYGALTYPQIAEWLNAHEDRIMGMVESEAARYRFTGDNLGGDYMDRLEAKDERTQLRQQVAALKRKLSNE